MPTGRVPRRVLCPTPKKAHKNRMVTILICKQRKKETMKEQKTTLTWKKREREKGMTTGTGTETVTATAMTMEIAIAVRNLSMNKTLASRILAAAQAGSAKTRMLNHHAPTARPLLSD